MKLTVSGDMRFKYSATILMSSEKLYPMLYNTGVQMTVISSSKAYQIIQQVIGSLTDWPSPFYLGTSQMIYSSHMK